MTSASDDPAITPLPAPETWARMSRPRSRRFAAPHRPCPFGATAWAWKARARARVFHRGTHFFDLENWFAGHRLFAPGADSLGDFTREAGAMPCKSSCGTTRSRCRGCHLPSRATACFT